MHIYLFPGGGESRRDIIGVADHGLALPRTLEYRVRDTGDRKPAVSSHGYLQRQLRLKKKTGCATVRMPFF
jgi:hypothetical protein